MEMYMSIIKEVENAMSELEKKQENEFKSLWGFLDKKSEELD